MKIHSCLVAGLVWVLVLPCLEAKQAPTSREVLSQTFTVDRKYKSMEGPSGEQRLLLIDSAEPELVWITGYRVAIVGEDGATLVSQEFMCHNNLDFVNVMEHNRLFGASKSLTSRIFTLSQGQFSIEFPNGFGMPVLSNESFQLTTQVLNHNLENPNAQVRHRVTLEFVRDRDLQEPMRPLYSTAPFVMTLLEGRDGYFGLASAPDETKHGPGCLPGTHAPHGTTTGVYEDGHGRKFSGHWVVPPGEHEYRTLVTNWMNLPFDTTLHYVAVHVHPFAESMELLDRTTGTSVFQSRITNPDGRIGVADVEIYSSEEGIPMYKDHEYELVSVYNNTTDVDQDAMATFFLYLLDKEFQKPTRVSMAANQLEVSGEAGLGSTVPSASEQSPLQADPSAR